MGSGALGGSGFRVFFKAAMRSQLYTVESGIILAGASAQLPSAIERRGKL